jgi:hypothetical protein
MRSSTDAATRAPFRVVRDVDPFIVLVDDVRMFKDGRAQVVAQSVDEALDALDRLHDKRIDELWLDYDIVGGTSQPVVDRLVTMAEHGVPADIGMVFVHSARVPEGLHVTQTLVRAGYRAERNYALGIWSRRTHTSW